MNHCRIKSKQENGQTKYFLVDQVTFDSLYSLINYYQNHHLRSINFGVTLTEAIPQVMSEFMLCNLLSSQLRSPTFCLTKLIVN